MLALAYPAVFVNLGHGHNGFLTAALARGDRVELRGFGAFSVKHRPARTGRNPRTGAHVSVDKKSVPFFKTGKEMRERLKKAAQ